MNDMKHPNNDYLELNISYSLPQQTNIWLPTEASLSQWVNHFVQNAPIKWPNYPQELNIRISSTQESQQLNNTYRQKNKPTNVLSFPYPDEDILGDMILCAQVISDEATQQNKTYQAHWLHMVIHGLLHLCGYDHQQEDEALHMESLEIKLLNQLGYTNPYNDDRS